MNKKQILTVLILAVVASASLFGGVQAYRYNRSVMNDSVFSSNIEAQADFWENVADFFGLIEHRSWVIVTTKCDTTWDNSGSAGGGYWGYHLGGSLSGSGSYRGEQLICQYVGKDQGEYVSCNNVDCYGRISPAGR